MSKKTLFIGAVASIIAINSVLADTTVTSKTYVDTTRQATIPAAGTNENTPGESIVTYTDTAGVIGERGIFNPETNFDYGNNEVAPGHEEDLVTAGSIFPTVGSLYQQIEQVTNLPETTVTYKTCYQEVNGDCILWNLSDKDVYGRCLSSTDCEHLDCLDGFTGLCRNGQCTCEPNR